MTSRAERSERDAAHQRALNRAAQNRAARIRSAQIDAALKAEQLPPNAQLEDLFDAVEARGMNKILAFLARHDPDKLAHDPDLNLVAELRAENDRLRHFNQKAG